MKIQIHLATDESIAVRRLANVLGSSEDDAVKTALRDWLIGNGYLELPESDNDNEEAVER